MPQPTTRPLIMGTRGVVTSGHYLATAAGFRILTSGGNAIDAAAAMCFCLNLLEPHQNGTGGEVPTLIYSAAEGKTYALSGMGWCPQDFTIGWCRENGIDLIPGDGYLPGCVPAVIGSWCLALARFGTKSFSEVARPAIELAEQGFPMYAGLHNAIRSNQEKFTERYPSTGEVYLTGGEAPAVGSVFRNPDWAATYRTLCEAEKSAASKGRVAGIEAARDAFYKGPVAERIIEFTSNHPVIDASGSEHKGLFTYDDFAEWQADLEEPVTFNYRGLDVHKCPSWTQGPVFLQQLAILEGYDVAGLGHNSDEYIHTVVEASKLAFADREAYYGDPRLDDVPFDRLLSKDYADARRSRIGAGAADGLHPGDLGSELAISDILDVLADNRRALGISSERSAEGDEHYPSHLNDTTQLDAVDREGNMVAATPSGGWIPASPVIPGLGFPMGTRGQMFYLNAKRANALEPRKRPRATLTPTIVTRDGRPYMAFGTPGGDSQDQWTLQFFLNYVDFGMNVQEALDAPSFHSLHFPSSFYPRRAVPQRVVVEDRITAGVIDALKKRGHDVQVTGSFSNGKPMGIRFDEERGVILGGCSRKGQIGYAMGW